MSEESKYTKDDFIHEIAKRTGYTIGSMKEVWGSIEEILKDIICYEQELVIPGLFKIYVTTIPEHEGHNAVKNEPMIIPESKRIVFKASPTLKNLFKDNEPPLE